MLKSLSKCWLSLHSSSGLPLPCPWPRAPCQALIQALSTCSSDGAAGSGFSFSQSALPGRWPCQAGPIHRPTSWPILSPSPSPGECPMPELGLPKSSWLLCTWLDSGMCFGCLCDRDNEKWCRFSSEGSLKTCFPGRFSKCVCKTAHVKKLCVSMYVCLNLMILGL